MEASGGEPQEHGHCMTHDLWSNLNRKMVDYLDSVSLQELVDQQRMRQVKRTQQATPIHMHPKNDALSSILA